MWKKINNIRNAGMPFKRQTNQEPLAEANKLIDQFTERSATANLDQETRDILDNEQEARRARIERAIAEEDPMDSEITLDEINQSFKTNTESAPGLDRIPYKMLHQTGPKFRELVKVVYDKVWKLKKLAKRWKKAKIIPIPKPQSNEKRPISLTATLGKNLERIAKGRLEAKINHKLHKNLFGFRRDRGCGDTLATTAQFISSTIFTHRIKNRKHNRCAAIFIDLEKAFELANADIILDELRGMEIRGSLLGYVQDYLKGRTGQVLVQGIASETGYFENGTPQGGVLSPLLFNVLINRILKLKLPKGVEIYSYADDLILLCNEKKQEELLNEALDMVHKETKNSGLKINIAKTKAMEFSLAGREDKKELRVPRWKSFYIGQIRIENVAEYKYLGVILTRTLSIASHVRRVRKQAYKRFNQLKYICGAKWGVSPQTAVKFVNMAIRPILEYGAPFYVVDRFNTSSIRSLEGLYKTCLRRALGVNTTANSTKVYIESGSEPLLQRMHRLTANIVTNIQNNPLEHPMLPMVKRYDDNYQANYRPRPNNKPPLTIQSKFSTVLLDQLMADTKDTPQYHAHLIGNSTRDETLSYFDKLKLKNMLIYYPMSIKKSALSDIDKKIEADRYQYIISQINPKTITYYTDGSVDNDHEICHADGTVTKAPQAGYGVFTSITQDKRSYHQWDSLLGGKLVSKGLKFASMLPELVAIKVALEHAAEAYDDEKKPHGTQGFQDIIIASDSLSGLNVICSGDTKYHPKVLGDIQEAIVKLSQRATIHLMWIPSHIGIIGNEWADKIAENGRKGLDYVKKKKFKYATLDIKATANSLKIASRDTYKNMWLKGVEDDPNFGDYGDINPTYSKPNIMKNKKLSREVQTSIIKLRLENYNFCSNNIPTTCAYCDLPFTTEHYLLECKDTQEFHSKLIDNIPASPGILRQMTKTELMIAILLQEEKNNYKIVAEMLNHTPVYVLCKEGHSHKDARPT